MNKQQKIKEAISLLEKVTGKKVILKESSGLEDVPTTILEKTGFSSLQELIKAAVGKVSLSEVKDYYKLWQEGDENLFEEEMKKYNLDRDTVTLAFSFLFQISMVIVQEFYGLEEDQTDSVITDDAHGYLLQDVFSSDENIWMPIAIKLAKRHKETGK